MNKIRERNENHIPIMHISKVHPSKNTLYLSIQQKEHIQIKNLHISKD